MIPDIVPLHGNYNSSYSDPLVDTTVARLHGKLNSDCFSFNLIRSIEESFYDVVRMLKDAYANVRLDAEIRCYHSRLAIVIATDSFMVVRDDEAFANGDPWQTLHRTITIVGHGGYNLVEGLYSYLSAHLTESKIPTVRWSTWKAMLGILRSSTLSGPSRSIRSSIRGLTTWMTTSAGTSPVR